MSRLRDERGQALALTTLFASVLLGMAALVVDVGAWFRADRRLQATADAAALAGAQALPGDPSGANALALEYAARNGGGVGASDVAVSTADEPNDTISVHASETVPGFFSRVLGVVSVEAAADATARAAPVARPRGVAPIAVHETHPLLQCGSGPCFDVPTQLTLSNLNDPESVNGSGSFGLVKLNKATGTIGTGTLASWVRDGYPDELSTGLYGAATGAKFNSSDFSSAMSEHIGDELLFPVYRSLVGTGQGAQFEIVAWVGFRVDSFSGSGDTGMLEGSFVRVTWEGSEGSPGASPDLGVRTVLLVE